MIDSHTAACCLIGAVEDILAEHAKPEAEHKYLSAAMTWPYCTHDAIVAREVAPTTEGPDFVAEYADRADRVASWYHVFEVALVRGAPPFPDSDDCLVGLYGTCEAPPDTTTLSGHHRLIADERGHLRDGLIEYWCECMAASGRAKTAPAWIESIETVNEGRFSGTTFTVAALLG